MKKKTRREEALYNVFSAKLIEMGVVSQVSCDMIARRGTRKEYLWTRHLMDLANFALTECKEREELCKEITPLCLKMLEWCKRKK